MKEIEKINLHNGEINEVAGGAINSVMTVDNPVNLRALHDILKIKENVMKGQGCEWEGNIYSYKF